MPLRSKTSLPSTRKQWEQEAKSHKVLDTSIHELLNVASASSIGEQYYSLRVSWKVKTFRLLDATVLGFSKNDTTYRQASNFLETESPPWQAYLADLLPGSYPSTADKVQDIGAFSSVRYYQLHVEPIPYIGSAEKAMSSVPSKLTPQPFTEHHVCIDRIKDATQARKGISSLDLDSFLSDSPVFDDSFLPPAPQSPISSETTSPSEDEQVVNFVLVLWLQTLVTFYPRIQEERLMYCAYNDVVKVPGHCNFG